MNEKNRIYWEAREKQKLEEQLKDVEKLEKELKIAFTKASRDIEKEIHTLFSRYAEDNHLNYAEASKYLTSKEFKRWKYDLKGYIELIEQTGDEKLLLELNTLAMKSRISRLEEMHYQINKYINTTFETYESSVYSFLGGSVTDSYYKTMYDMHKLVGYGTSFSLVDEKMIKEIISYPWSGKNYSERIWTNRDKLKDVLSEEITQMIIQGKDARSVSKSLAERMDVSVKRASDLIQTEHSWVMSEASARSMEEFGIDEYEYSAALDDRTCKTCGPLDGKVFKLSERAPGVNSSPMHTKCRCTELPKTDIGLKDSYRFARDGNDKAIKVPQSMKYDEWQGIFIGAK